MQTQNHHYKEIHQNEKRVHKLVFINLFIDTNQELVVFMPRSCHVCKSEGFQALTRLTISFNEKSIVDLIELQKYNPLQVIDFFVNSCKVFYKKIIYFLQ